MNPLYRLYLSFILLTAFITMFCVVWLENWHIQIIGLGLALVTASVVFNPRRLLKELKLLLPLILLLALVYGIFAFFEIGFSSTYWLHYGLSRTALLLNTLLFMQILISRIKLDDFLYLPWNINKLKYIILGKLLYNISISAYEELSCFNELIPSEQEPNPHIKKRIKSRLITLLALISLIIGEATRKGERIDACIINCHAKENR